MSEFERLILRVKRGDTSATRALRDAYRWAARWNMPDTRWSRAIFAGLYRAHDGADAANEYLRGKLLYEPMVRARFASVGARLQVTALPYVVGHARVSVGDDCRFGYFSVKTGRFVDDPELCFGDSVSVGSNVSFIVNRSIVIGSRVGIAPWCWLADSDGHPTDPESRSQGKTEIPLEAIERLVIEDDVWLGHGAKVLKGVTLGKACVVAAGSVVSRDVPPGALAMGSPARVLTRPW